MSDCAWLSSEGHDKGALKASRQAVNLYVQPELSPKLNEQFLQDAALPLPFQTLPLQRENVAGQCLDVVSLHGDGVSAPFHQECAVIQRPCSPSEWGSACEPSNLVMSVASIDDGAACACHNKQYWQPPEHTISLQNSLGHQGNVLPPDCNNSPRLCLSDFPEGALPRPGNCQGPARLSEQQQQQRDGPRPGTPSQQPRMTEPTSLHTPAAAATAPPPSSPSAGPQNGAALGNCASNAQPRETPAAAVDTVSVHSLSLSGQDRELFDQLLGPEPAGVSPRLVTPLSWFALGPFGETGMQPTLSGNSQRPTPAQLSALLDAEMDSGASTRLGPSAQQQPGLVSSYSEPLPLTTAASTAAARLMRQIVCAAAAAKAAKAAIAAAKGASAHAGQHPTVNTCGTFGGGQPEKCDRPAEGCAQQCATGQANAMCTSGSQQQDSQQQRQQDTQQSQGQGPQVSTPQRVPRRTRVAEEPGPLPPAHSAPAASFLERPPHGLPVAPSSAAGASCLMHTDGPGRSMSCYTSMSTGGAAAISAGTALEAAQFPGAAGCPGGGAGPAPMQQSPSNGRGKRLRQQLPDGTAMGGPAPTSQPALEPPAQTAPPAAVAAAPSGRPGSPSGRSYSGGGDPMSVCMDGDSMYSHGAGYSYPYGMPPPYGVPPYGMPYGDPYYHHPAAYGYHPDASLPPPAASDPMAQRCGGTHPSYSHSQGLPYPYMALRQRLYRRVGGGPNGRRDGFGPGFEAHSGAMGSEGGLISMVSAPAVCAASGPAQPSVNGRAAHSASMGATAAPSSCPPAAVRTGFEAATTSAFEAPPSGCFADGRHGQPTLPAPRRTSQEAMEAEMESAQAARACHEQFSADDMPLPLPRSTVDGIRQELRIVTQELLQRRMGEARNQKRLAAATEGAQGFLQPANSWAPGDAPCSRPAPMVPNMQQQHPAMSAAAEAQGNLAAPAFAQLAPVNGSATTLLPHKRAASAGPPTSAGTSPVRARPAPSAPTGQFAQAQGFPAPGLPAVRRSGGYSEGMLVEDAGSRPAAGFAAPAPVRPGQASSGAMPGPGSNAMRQLFPPPTNGTFSQAPSVCGSAPTQPASVGTGKPAMPGGATASAPPGPRPAMSGKSAASATQSASVAQAAPLRGARQQNGGAAVPMGSYRVGQQGSMAAEAEDDGEEVHGPPQRNSCNRPTGHSHIASSSAVCGPLPPPAPHCYYSSMPPPPPYDYPPSYYYPPPPMPAYGVRMYGMPPQGMPPAPPGYRGPSAAGGVSMYGMPPPPSMAYSMSQPMWPEYGMPPMPQPGASAMVPGSTGVAPQVKRSCSTAGAYPAYASVQPGVGKE